MCWTAMASMLKKEGYINDNCSKKSSKIFKRFCKTNIWNKRIDNKKRA